MGTATMIVGIILMIVIHEGGHFLAAKAFGLKATEAFLGFGPRLWSFTRGETEYGVKAILLGGYVRIAGMDPFEEIDPSEEARTYRTAPFWKKTVVVLAGIFTHFVTAAILLTIVYATWGIVQTDERGATVPSLRIGAVVDTLPDGSPSPSSLGGFEEGDRLVSYDGTELASWRDFVHRVRGDAGEQVVIGYERDGAPAEATVTLASREVPVVVDGEEVTDSDGEPVYEEIGYFGAASEAARDRPGPLGVAGAVGRRIVVGVGDSVNGLWEMVIGFPKLVSSLFGGSREVLYEVRPISPIGLVRIAGPMENTLMLLVLVNIFVGVLNFVPLYPLDGGHFIVALYEKVTGRVPDVRKLIPVAAVVLVFLVAVGVIGIYLDIFDPIRL